MKEMIMKKMLSIFFLIIAGCLSLAAQSFTAGNIVVVRVGDGSGNLASASTAVFLDEYTTGGTFVQSIAIPTSASGSNAPLTLSGSATSEGSIVGSVDKRYLTIAGYGAAPLTPSIASTASATVNRVVARIDATASMDITTKLSDASSGNNIRGAATNDGTAFWVAGADGGVRYAALGATSSTQLSITDTNIRVMNIFNSQLYASSGQASYVGINSVGSGLPTSSGATITNLFAMDGTSPSPYGFSISPDGNSIYIADDRSIANGGGVQKWVFGGSTWSHSYTLKTNLSKGIRGLAVDWSGTNPVIYASDATGSLNNLVRVTDAGSSSPFTTLATAATNEIFRGVAFTPNASITFTDGTSYTPPAGTRNTNDNPIGRFQLAGNIAGGKLTQAVVTLSGTYSGVANLKLYYSTAATFSVEASTVLATVASPSSPVTFDFSSAPQLIPTSGAYLYVAADLSSGATGAAMASLADQTALTFTNASLTGTFSGANLSSGSVDLPVELTAFTAAATSSMAILKWSTATEVNNTGFDVERCPMLNTAPATDWQKMGFVAGAGTSNAPHEYSFTDKNITSGRYTYRLKQIDRDGSFKYSQSAEVEVGTVPQVYSLSQNYPDPFNPTTTITYSLPGDENIRLAVYDILGSEVGVLVSGVQTAGSHQVMFSGSNLGSGIYFYKLESSGQTIIKKMILLK